MFWLITTRFNEITWNENKVFRERNKIACIYGISQTITEKIPINSLIIVIEMNNDKNCIEGMGLIRNKPEDSRYKIYENYNWNRFCYIGKYYINREAIIRENPLIVELLDHLLFKGKTHMKRGIGMTLLTDKVKQYIPMDYPLEREVRQLFLRMFDQRLL